MAIGIETPGQFAELLGILKKRRWQIILPVCFGIAIGAAVGIFVPKKYEISTTIELRERALAAEANSRTPKTPSTSREITNAENHIKHFKRIREVIEEEGWPEYELLSGLQKAEFIEKVKDNLTVNVLAKRKDEGSTFMDITYLASDPEQGESFLSKLSHLWVEEVVDRERTALREEARGLQNQVVEANKAFTAASKEVLRLVNEGKLSPNEIDPGKDRPANDPDFVRLNEQRDRLGKLSEQLAGYDAAMAKLQATLLVTPEEVPVDLVAQGIDQTAKVILAENAIAELRKKQALVTPRNQTYVLLQNEIQNLEETIAQLKASQRSTEIVQEFRPNEVRAGMLVELDRLAVESEMVSGQIGALALAITENEALTTSKSDLKERLYLAIQRRDHLRENHDLLDQALQEKTLALDALDNAYGDPYEFVQDAVAPEKPSQPQPLFIITIGLFVGLVVGMGSSLAAEFARDGYRTAADLARSMNLPVLGVVDRISTRGERSARFFRRTVVGLTSVLLIVALLGLTYAYSQRPELLPVRWLERLDEWRASFR